MVRSKLALRHGDSVTLEEVNDFGLKHLTHLLRRHLSSVKQPRSAATILVLAEAVRNIRTVAAETSNR